MTQQTMTKEQIIRKYYPFYDENLSIMDVELNGEQVQNLMEEYKEQEVAKEREKAKKMVDDMKVIAEKVGYIWVREDILKSIEKYNENTLDR